MRQLLDEFRLSSWISHLAYREGSLALTLWASSGLCFLVLVLDKGAQDVVALVAVVLDDGELRQNAGRGRHHSARPDQLVEVKLAQRPEFLHQGELGDADAYFLGDGLVLGKHGEDDRLGGLVENGQDLGGSLGEEVSQDLAAKNKAKLEIYISIVWRK